MSKSSLHIQHNLTPSRLRIILAGAAGGRPLREVVSELGIREDSLRKRVFPFVRQTGLLEIGCFGLTESGARYHRFAERSPDLLPEAMHHWLYTAHVSDKIQRFSWAYAAVADALWASGERELDGEALIQLVGTVVDEAARRFNVPIEQIAFSCHSVRGVLNWLRALEPPVVVNTGGIRVFRRRYFCPPVAFLWGVDFLYRTGGTAHGVRMFLSSDRMEQICRMCVLDPSGFDNVLMMAKRMSDYERGGIFDYGTEGGFGRWLLLAHPCLVPSLPEGVT